MPVDEGRAQPKIGPRDSESGAVRREDAAHLSAITHIGCVYADEASIGSEYDPDVSSTRQFVSEHLLLGPVGPALRNAAKKKAR
jgi:hypothetical protein